MASVEKPYPKPRLKETEPVQDKTPFDTMRRAYAPKGAAPVTNLTVNLASPHFDADIAAAAIDAAEARVTAVAEIPDIAEPLSPLETFAIQVLMRASGQN